MACPLANPIGSASHATYIPPSSNPATITQALQNQLDIMTGASRPALRPIWSPTAAHRQPGRLHRLHPTAQLRRLRPATTCCPTPSTTRSNVQWQPPTTWPSTIGYTGNRGRHSVIPIPFNEPGIATSTNPIWGETATYGFQVLNQNMPASTYGLTITTPIAGEPWNTDRRRQHRLPRALCRLQPQCRALQDGRQLGLRRPAKRTSKSASRINFQAGASYTWSHALDEQSDIGLFFTGDNPNNLRDSWASSDFDRTHVFTANFQFDGSQRRQEHIARSPSSSTTGT